MKGCLTWHRPRRYSAFQKSVAFNSRVEFSLLEHSVSSHIHRCIVGVPPRIGRTPCVDLFVFIFTYPTQSASYPSTCDSGVDGVKHPTPSLPGLNTVLGLYPSLRGVVSCRNMHLRAKDSFMSIMLSMPFSCSHSQP